ncbi:MAG: ATP-binding protein [Methylococcaceae bacterium]|nr:ATP-binding protein [Methylococcaceae bacterium]
MSDTAPSQEQLLCEVEGLRARLEEVEETLRAIRSGEVDALVVSTAEGERIYSLRGTEQPYRVMVETMSEGAVTLAPDGAIIYSNQRFADLLHTGLEQVIGSMLQRFVQPDQGEHFAHLLERSQTRGIREKITLQTPDGLAVPVSITLRSLLEYGVQGIVAVVFDLTEIATAEAALRNYQEHLQTLVRERTAKLEELNQELEGFAYSVSHDLRVPLRAIDGFSRILLTRYQDMLDDEGKRYLNLVRDNVKRMSQLIDDILAFSRMGRVGMAASEVDMETMARAVWEELKSTAAERNLDMAIKPLPPSRGDLAMLHQVWVNLLSNAIKFTRPKTMASIEVGGYTEGAEQVYYVRDNGVGFDMQYVHKLFGVFQRLHGVDEFEGTGIGLAIVKRIITRHGGRVWAQARVDEGACFYFTLPDLERNP